MARYLLKGTARDGNGKIIASATISVYLAGTTTAASVYEAYSGGTAVNSVTSSSDGTFSFYVDDTDYTGLQRFKCVIGKTGYTSITYDYITIFDVTAIIDTDTTFASAADTVVPSQLAAKTYIDATSASAAAAVISNTAYGSSWDTVTTIAPSKNAVYDKIEAIVSDAAYAASWDGVTTIAPSKHAVYDAIEANKSLAGEIKMWPTETVPDGYLECDGSSLLRATYATLFAIIGTMYGTADATHFNLPDLRGRFVRSWDNTLGTDPDSATRTVPSATGATLTAGDHVGTEQADELESHTHTASPRSNTDGGVEPYATVGSGAIVGGSISLENTGGNETRPVNTYMMMIIKY